MMLGKYRESLDSFRKGSELVHSYKVYEYYLHEVENLKKQSLFVENSNNPGFIAEDKSENPAEVKKVSLEDEISSFDSMDEQKINTSSSTPGSDSIVSETLANIYMTQGEFREALKIFEKLLNKNPQKKDYYLQRDLYQVTISKPQQKLKCPYCKKEFSREKETSADKT